MKSGRGNWGFHKKQEDNPHTRITLILPSWLLADPLGQINLGEGWEEPGENGDEGG